MSFPLGIDPTLTIPASAAIALEPGDIAFFLTDGLLEARSPDGHAFGAERALDIVRVYHTHPAQGIVENLYHAVRAFCHNAPQDDDITAVVLKVEAVS